MLKAVQVSSIIIVILLSLPLLVSCDLVSHQEPIETPVNGELWQQGDWSIRFDGGYWQDCTVTINLHIHYSGDRVADFEGDDPMGLDFAGIIYVRDKYAQDFCSTYSENSLHCDAFGDWYQQEYYPNESRDGTLQFNIDPRSESIWLFTRGGCTNLYDRDVFYLGAVPNSCN